MSEQDNLPQEGTNPELDTEVEETVADTETEDSQEDTGTDDVEALKQQLAEANKAKAAILQRAKKAEQQLKKTKQPSQINSPAHSLEDIEATVLKSQGIPDDILRDMKALAKVRGKSLLDIQNDPIILTLKKQREDEEKASKAKLGVSKSTAAVKKEVSFNTPGLSDEEHKRLWKEANGR